MSKNASSADNQQATRSKISGILEGQVLRKERRWPKLKIQETASRDI